MINDLVTLYLGTWIYIYYVVVSAPWEFRIAAVAGGVFYLSLHVPPIVWLLLARWAWLKWHGAYEAGDSLAVWIEAWNLIRTAPIHEAIKYSPLIVVYALSHVPVIVWIVLGIECLLSRT